MRSPSGSLLSCTSSSEPIFAAYITETHTEQSEQRRSLMDEGGKLLSVQRAGATHSEGDVLIPKHDLELLATYLVCCRPVAVVFPGSIRGSAASALSPSNALSTDPSGAIIYGKKEGWPASVAHFMISESFTIRFSSVRTPSFKNTARDRRVRGGES